MSKVLMNIKLAWLHTMVVWKEFWLINWGPKWAPIEMDNPLSSWENSPQLVFFFLERVNYKTKKVELKKKQQYK